MKRFGFLVILFTLFVSGCVVVEDENAHKVDNVLTAIQLRSEIPFPEASGADLEWKTDEGILKISGKGYTYVDPNPDQNQLMSSVLIFFRNYSFQRDVLNSQRNTEPFSWAYTQEGVACIALHVPMTDTDLATDYRLDIRCGLLEKGVLTPWEEIRFSELMSALSSGPAKEFSAPQQSVFKWIRNSGDASDTFSVTGQETALETTAFDFVPFDTFFTERGFTSDAANSSRTETSEIRAYMKDTLACTLTVEIMGTEDENTEDSEAGNTTTRATVRCGVLH